MTAELETHDHYLPSRTLESIPGSVTVTSLALDKDVSYERWARTGELLGNLMKANGWWIGDWIIFGEDHKEWGEMYTQALAETGLGPSTLHNYVWVSRSVAPERRRADLTWTHHQAVAKLKPSQQSKWLEHAAAGGWSVSDLKREIDRHYNKNGKQELDDIDKAVKALEMARQRVAEASSLGQDEAMEAILLIDQAINRIKHVEGSEPEEIEGELVEG